MFSVPLLQDRTTLDYSQRTVSVHSGLNNIFKKIKNIYFQAVNIFPSMLIDTEDTPDWLNDLWGTVGDVVTELGDQVNISIEIAMFLPYVCEHYSLLDIFRLYCTSPF